jgi:putative ABC transport system permease protein
MSLLGFRYLRKQRIIALILILTLTSTLFSVTAFSFVGFYNGFTDYVGEDKDVIAVYGTAGSTPLTGIVPVYLADTVGAVNGVLAVSPEVIAPCTINNQSVFVRGVLPQELDQINPLTVLEGQGLNFSDTNAAIIGKSLAERLHLKVGDSITALGTLSDKYVELQVKGIFQSGSPLDDEAVVPLYVGQWLRGLHYNQATLIRVKIDVNQASANTLYAAVAKEASQPASTPPPAKTETQKELEALLPLTKASFNLGSISVTESQDFMKSYLDRYGVSKDTLIAISVVVLLFASGTAASAITLFINQHRDEIGVLRSVGASTRAIKKDLAVKVLSWSLVSSTLGIVLGMGVLLVLQQVGYLLVLSHRIIFQFDPLIVAANFLLISAIVAVTIGKAEVKR